MSAEDKNLSHDKKSADVKRHSDDGHGHPHKNKASTPSKQNLPPVSEAETSAEQADNSNRVDAAKAFYRAIYAGDDVSADKYGMNVETMGNPKKAAGTCVNCDQLAAEFQQAQAKTAEIEGLYKRMAADFDNYRKRIEREREDLVGIGVQKAVETLLPALDDLERAQTTFDNNSELSNVIESLKLIAARFTKCLEQLGIKPLETIGQPFDPRLHEPVQQIVTSEVPEGAVAHELRRGYTLGEKVIRPTLVNVATGGPSQTDQDHQSQAGAQDNDNPSDTVAENNQ